MIYYALHACTDEVQVSWSADDDVCGSPSRGEKSGDTNRISDETGVVIGSFSNVMATLTADAAGTNTAACCACPH